MTTSVSRPRTRPAAPILPHGIREFVVGTGGKNQLPLGTVTSNSQARNNTTFGVLELTLHPPDAAHPTGSYHWLFRDDKRSGGFADAGSADCVRAPTDVAVTGQPADVTE